jgi:hypothetical protein
MPNGRSAHTQTCDWKHCQDVPWVKFRIAEYAQRQKRIRWKYCQDALGEVQNCGICPTAEARIRWKHSQDALGQVQNCGICTTAEAHTQRHVTGNIPQMAWVKFRIAEYAQRQKRIRRDM